MSTYDDKIIVSGSMAFRERIVGPADLTPEGVLVFDTDDKTAAALVTVEAGTLIKGFAMREGGEDVTGIADGNIRWFTIRCQTGAGFAIAHESGDVLDASHAVTVIGGSSPSQVGIDDRAVQVIYDQATSRWLVPDWSAGSGAASTAYSGVTAGGGLYSEAFAEAYSNVPNVVASVIGGTEHQYAVVTSRTETGFTVTAYTQNVVDIVGIEAIAGTPTPTDGLTVDVLVTSND